MSRGHGEGGPVVILEAQGQAFLSPSDPPHTSPHGSEVVREPHQQVPVHAPCIAGRHRELLHHTRGPD